MQHSLALTPAGEAALTAERMRRRIATHTEKCLALCDPLCARQGCDVPSPVIRFDLRGRAAGQAIWYRGRSPTLRFNLDIALRHAEDFIATTVPHEVAHVIVATCHGRVRPHGHEWQSVMRYLGIDEPRRCHDYTLADETVKKQQRWPYACACSSHQLSTTRHNRVVRGGASYVCRRCGDTLRFAGKRT